MERRPRIKLCIDNVVKKGITVSQVPVNPVADDFLKRYAPVATEKSIWRGGEIKLVVSAYLTDDQPPSELVSSVRALVFRGDNILLMRNRGGIHILPGGRIEPGEAKLDALQREILEEAGVRITDIQSLGFMHLRHQTPKPPNYPYPYPDFFWPVFTTHFHSNSNAQRQPDDYEISAEFVPIARLSDLGLRLLERAFLDAATRAQ